MNARNWKKNWSLWKTVGPKKNFTASCHYDMRKIIMFEGEGVVWKLRYGEGGGKGSEVKNPPTRNEASNVNTLMLWNKNSCQVLIILECN